MFLYDIAPIAGVIDLNGPGRYLHWSIFTVSVANLALIVAMVVIFGAALLIPFPQHRKAATGAPGAAPSEGDSPPPPSPTSYDLGDDADAAMWTSRIRRRALRMLPPGKLLPDRQPAYVSSWIYVFGVAALATLGLVIASGTLIAIGGTDWWHTNPVGHFFNSLHMWSVEAFMAFTVIHLWGKFWMAAWRGRRWVTWMTGVVAFGASVLECFTGYLSQQNFDSQWIAASGKDAFNSVGVGAFFNVMDVGQMLLWHVLLIPVILIALVGAHVLAVRVRGVVPPLPEHRVVDRAARKARAASDRQAWRGSTRRYDIVKEATMATVIAGVLVVALASILSSPDVPPVTVASWAKVAPADFLATASSELAGTSLSATYGQPYNNGTGSVQNLLGLSPQRAVGVRTPLHPAQTFVLGPLQRLAGTDPAVAAALARYEAATPAVQARWNAAYATAVTKVRFAGSVPVVPAATDGPLPVLLSSELTMARSGAIDADLVSNRSFYGTNFTAPLLFLGDGQYFANQASALHLDGTQWGVMNETGSYPGQPWLWLYTIWYQVPGFRTSANVDIIAVALTGVGTVLLLAVPFVPGLRDIPRFLPLHRLVWRNWNGRGTGPGHPDGPTGPVDPTASSDQAQAAPEIDLAPPPAREPVTTGNGSGQSSMATEPGPNGT
jgi:hypothetical protein